MVPIEAATAHGVLVANVPGVNANAVAEDVLRSMLQLARGSTAVAAPRWWLPRTCAPCARGGRWSILSTADAATDASLPRARRLIAPVHSAAMQGQLFTQDFLLRGVSDTPPWQALNDDALTRIFHATS